ncbi:hypothetical protein C1E24_20635 [Pseudoalteromonas phenolica]|uniref:NYN domain-containing protein n=1 Tax=Pseudoalteromonas phenolica TaxID=161398 RepID=A0A5R9PWA2_9GAMM|nr:NYN domain-containing protein [Pseudoalteromonas phenolica]TLX45101.1 hypothetical protein C1E24_20635 [Pseudoalteromonas phenolica]
MLRAAFIDFDNLYGCYANEFSRNFSSELLIEVFKKLEFSAPISIKRAYINCAMFSKYAKELKKAGFEIIDCPPLTYHGKTAADQKLVIDAMKVLLSDVPPNELYVLSADADFTPLVNEASDKGIKSTIGYFGRKVSECYLLSASRSIKLDKLLNDAAPKVDVIHSQHLGDALAFIIKLIEQGKPVHINEFMHTPLFKGISNNLSRYGFKKFGDFIKAFPLDDIKYHSGYLYDPSEYSLKGSYPNVVISKTTPAMQTVQRNLQCGTNKIKPKLTTSVKKSVSLIRTLFKKLKSITGLPTTNLPLMKRLFTSLEKGLKKQCFKTRRLVQFVAQRLDSELTFNQIESVIIRIRTSGHQLSYNDDAHSLAIAFSQFVFKKCQLRAVSLTSKERGLIQRWINHLSTC